MPDLLLKRVGRRHLLYVMAARPEYGPALEARFSPLFTGIGPVEAALSVGKTLARLEAKGKLPDVVICLGSAGSRTLEQTKIYQVASVSYRDMDASALGFEKGLTPFLDLPARLELPFRIQGLPSASLSSGADIVSGIGYDRNDEDMVDMETFAVMRACMAFDIPLVGLRGISDGAEDLKHVDDWTRYLEIIDKGLAAAVDRVDEAFITGLMD